MRPPCTRERPAATYGLVVTLIELGTSHLVWHANPYKRISRSLCTLPHMACTAWSGRSSLLERHAGTSCQPGQTCKDCVSRLDHSWMCLALAQRFKPHNTIICPGVTPTRLHAHAFTVTAFTQVLWSDKLASTFRAKETELLPTQSQRSAHNSSCFRATNSHS